MVRRLRMSCGRGGDLVCGSRLWIGDDWGRWIGGLDEFVCFLNLLNGI